MQVFNSHLFDALEGCSYSKYNTHRQHVKHITHIFSKLHMNHILELFDATFDKGLAYIRRNCHEPVHLLIECAEMLKPHLQNRQWVLSHRISCSRCVLCSGQSQCHTTKCRCNCVKRHVVHIMHVLISDCLARKSIPGYTLE